MEPQVHNQVNRKQITTPTYRSWVAMKTRCFNPARGDYHLYGGRGITVCKQWRQSFACFLADMGERPEGRTLDRLDPNGNYEPSNCRWATVEEQARNKRVPAKPVVTVRCGCGASFEIPQAHIDRGRGKFCSRACANATNNRRPERYTGVYFTNRKQQDGESMNESRSYSHVAANIRLH
jgi:hypothetical protein